MEALDIEKVQDKENPTEPDGGTRKAEHSEADAPHTADRPSTSDEAAGAEQQRKGSDPQDRKSVAQHYEEMADLGANIKGEDEID